MAFKIIEFSSMDEYLQWLTRMGERIKVIHMVTQRDRFSFRNGETRNIATPSYIVTYKEIAPPPPEGDGKLCFSCGVVNAHGFKFCEVCGAPLFKPSARQDQ